MPKLKNYRSRLHTCILKTEDEDELIKVILKFQAAGFPLTLSKVHSLAYQVADLNNIKGFSSKSKKVGRKWAKFYLKHYPEIRGYGYQ